jgi:hypothetical protein
MRASVIAITLSVDFGIRQLAVLGAVCIALALLLREGLLYRILGIAIVRSDGSPVSRLRAVARALVIWLPALIAWAILPGPFSADTWRVFVAGVPVIPMAAAAVYAAGHPTRGVPERFTDTYLVRR